MIKKLMCRELVPCAEILLCSSAEGGLGGGGGGGKGMICIWL